MVLRRLFFIALATIAVASWSATDGVEVVSRSDSRTVLRFDFSDMTHRVVGTQFGDVLFCDLPGSGSTAQPGRPDLPTVGTFVAIPDNAKPTVRVISADSTVLEGVLPAPYSDLTETREGVVSGGWYADKAVYLSDRRYPETAVSLGRPGVMRGMSVVGVTAVAAAAYPSERRTVVYKSITVEVAHAGGRVGPGARPALNGDFFGGVIGAPSRLLESGSPIAPTTFLVIHPPTIGGSDPLPVMQTFFTWKRRQGYNVVVRSTSQTGNTDTAIRNYVSAYYDTCAAGLEAVLLVGDEDQGLPTHIYYYQDPNPADHWYACVDGNDYFADLLIGRFAVDNTGELAVVATKTIGYDANADPAGTWYGHALMLAVEGYDPRPNAIITSAVTTKRWLQDHMYATGYTQVDTLFEYTDYGIHPTPAEITASINAGKGAVNYRGYGWYDGWYGPNYFVWDAQALANGWRLPVITSIVCGTGNFGSSGTDPCFGEYLLRKGTVSNPSGCVGFIGCTYGYLSTRFNNCLDAGLWWSVLYGGVRTVGVALDAGKNQVYVDFPLDRGPGQQVELYYMTYVVLGDPTLRLRVRTPDMLAIAAPESIAVGTPDFLVSVSIGGQPVSGARVTLTKGDELSALAITDETGTVRLPGDNVAGQTLLVTATADDAVPASQDVAVYTAPAYAAFDSYTIDDDGTGSSSGNGDGIPNPGETLELPTVIRNYGTGALTGVSAVLRTDDQAAQVPDSVETFPDVSPGGIAASTDDFDVLLSPAMDHGHVVRLELGVVANEGGPWTSWIAIQAAGSLPSVVSVAVIDGGNGRLDPGETADLVVRLANGGVVGMNGLTGTLTSGFAGVAVADQIGSWPDLPPGDSVENSADPFTVSALPSVAPGRTVSLALSLSAVGGYQAWLPFMIEVGAVGVSDPLGPDAYGYYAYDNGDATYPAAPAYGWIELDPTYGGSGATQLALGDDGVVSMDLPFAVAMYGETFTRLTVCTNGWASLGDFPYAFFHNWYMPGPLAAPAMIAPFWDDLTTQYGGKVFVRHDPADGRYVVEWSRVRHTDDMLTDQKTFELIIENAGVHPTPTGDASFVVQYQAINNNDAGNNYATAGICDPTQTVGLTYTFANQYPSSSAPLVAGRAIRFTTTPPDTFYVDAPGGVAALPAGVVLEPARPNPFNPTTTLSYFLPEGGPVRLEVTNLLGQRVALLADGFRPTGWHTATFEAGGLASGVYIAYLTAGGSVYSAKLLLIR